MNLRVLIDATDGLKKLACQDLPISTSFKLQVLYDSIKGYLENFSIQHAKLLSMYGTPVDNKPGVFNFTPENAVLYNKELDILLAVNVLVVLEKVDIKMTDNILVSAMDIVNTRPFINYTEED